MDGKQILDIEMGRNDADAKTVRGYLKLLLSRLWAQGEGFNGKRPFGNSGWEYELYVPLISAGVVKGSVDEEGDLMEVDETAANTAILKAIEAL